MKRLFLAIPLPEDVRKTLAAVVKRAAAAEVPHWGDRVAKWVPPENLHVTLKFLGDVAEGDIEPLVTALAKVASPGPFKLHTHQLELFPKRGPVRVITAGLDGDLHSLTLLHRGIEGVTEEFGVQRDDRPYRPHVTLGRVRSRVEVRRRCMETLSGISQIPPAEFAVTEFVLMESRLSQTGSTYTPIAQFPLDKK
jgi:RNA 2',3'-cyclic 3'-phosphodiesterase